MVSKIMPIPIYIGSIISDFKVPDMIFTL